MIFFHDVTVERGKRHFKRVIMRDVNWRINPRAKVVIFGHRLCGVEAMPGIISGMAMPTSGWIERLGSVSPTGGFLRYGFDSLYQLVSRLSRLYQVDPKEVREFVEQGLERRDLFHVRPRFIPPQIQKQLDVLLTYAFPFDFYLFASPPNFGRGGHFGTYCRRAHELRCRQAGLIVVANSTKNVRGLGDDVMGALLYRGHFTLYANLEDAILVFNSLPPEHNKLDAIESVENDELDSGLDFF